MAERIIQQDPDLEDKEEEDNILSYSLHEKRQTSKQQLFSLDNIIILVLAILVVWSFWPTTTPSHISSTTTESTVPDNTPLTTLRAALSTASEGLPKIMWVYTHGELKAQHFNNIIYYYHLNHTASQLGYQVRVVNAWTAYKWIKNQTRIAEITYYIQNTRIDQTVDSLLKLALLIEHGGIMIGNLNAVINTNLTWLQNMFSSTIDLKLYTCPRPHLYMVEFSDPVFGLKFYQDFIAALPNSQLLKETMQVLQSVLLSGQFPSNKQLKVLTRRYLTNVDLFPQSISNSLSYLIWNRLVNLKNSSEEFICLEYGMQRAKQKFVFDLNQFPEGEKPEFMFNPQERPQQPLIIHANTSSVNRALGGLIEQPNNITRPEPGSVMFLVLSAPGNREVFIDAPPDRSDLPLCLVVMDQLSSEQVEDMIFQVRSQQSDVDWQLVMFTSVKRSVQVDRVTTLQSEENQIRNIEVAVCKVCKKRSYAVLLHKGEKFASPFSLDKIVEVLQPRFIVGAAIDLIYEGKTLHASENYLSFSRSEEGVVEPYISKMEGILNHFRIFSVEAFRYIPQFDHVDIFGNYFKDRLIFLMTLLEMLNIPREGPYYNYVYLKYYPLFNIPQSAILIPPSVKIKTSIYDKVDMSQLQKTRARFDAEPVRKTMEEISIFEVAFDKLLVFNPGDKFVPVTAKTGPDLIPKVIHQAWLGSKMGVSQVYFFNKAKIIYPNYEFKLWGEENVTRENFPLTYHVIKNLIDFNKNRASPFNKLATATDIIRHQALYRQGGFWRDAGMNYFRPVFDHFLKYDFVVGAERTLRHRWNMGMCFFANAPKSVHLARITALPNINKMRIYGDVALDIAGPFDFRNAVIGYEEYSPSVLLMNYEYFYPGEVGRHPFDDLCTRYEHEYLGQAFHFKYKGCYLLEGCEQFYPEAFGLDHNCFGVSWAKRKG